jgi:RHS repeat-associated protein
MDQLTNVRLPEERAAESVCAVKPVVRNDRFKAILGRLLLCLLALSFVAGTWQRPAHAQSAEGFVGWTSPGGPYGVSFLSAMQACEAQRQYNNNNPGSHILPLKPQGDNPNIRYCNWTTWGEGCIGEISFCGTTYPAYVLFGCASGYVPAQGTACVQDVARKPCKDGKLVNPKVGNPIILATGSKLVTAKDFATSDGAFVISRTYRSLPGISGSQYLPRNLGGNWNFDFGYEVQLGPFSGAPSSPNAKVTVVAPDSSAYDFVLQSDGTWVPDTTTGAFFAPTDLKLEYLGTLPSDLSTIRGSSSQWRLTDGDDTVWTFQTFTDVETGSAYRIGRPTSRVTREGYQWTFAYRPDRSLQTLTDSYGRQATFTWAYYYPTNINPAPAGYEPYAEAISSIALPDGTTLRFTYEPPPVSSGPSTTHVIQRLVKVERLNASSTVIDSTTYAYADPLHPRHITSVTDFRGVQVATYTYDARGRALSTAKGGGADSYSVDYAETSTERTRTVTNPLGKVAVYHFTKLGSGNEYRLASVEGEASTNCPSSARSIAYDTNNFIASEVDEEGRTTTYTRDSRGRPLTITEAAGTPLARTTTITWDSSLNLPDVIARPGLTESRAYTSGHLATLTQTDNTTITTPYATNGRTHAWAYDWTSTGLLNSVDGPLPGTADTVSFTYDAFGQQQTRTDEVGLTTQVISRDSRGAPLTLQDAHGIQTIITYDAMGRPLTVTTNPGSSQSQYVMEYDNAGNLKKLTMPQGGWLSYTYDDASRVTRIDNNRGEYRMMTLNGLGEATAQTVKNAGGTITQQSAKNYDELGRVLQAIGAGSQTWAYQYDKVNRLTQTTDARSKQWATGWDALDRVITQTDPTSAQQQSSYAANDQLTQYKDGRNVTTDRIVDGFGNTIYENSPDKGARTFWYDGANRLTQVEDADTAGTADENVAYTYDSTDSGNFGLGRLTGAVDPSGSTALGYDAQGRLISDTKTIQSRTYQVAYTYDANGAVTSITYPSGHVVTYVRASDGKITAVQMQPSAGGTVTNLATGVAYAPFGPLTGLTYGNGLVLTRNYDQNYWLSGINLAGSSTLLNLSFARDANGNVTGVTDNASSGRAATYGYTDNDRVASAAGPWGSDVYAWDASGNRTRVDRTSGSTVATDAATIASGSNRLTEIRDASAVLTKAFTLRAGGDLAQQVSGSTTFDYVYSPRKRLASLKTNTVEVASYLYDYAGHRVARTLPATSQVIHYIYDQAGQLIAEQDGTTGALLREYVWLDGMPLALVTGTVATPQFAYVHTGQIGEPLMATDASQAKLWDVALDPWGNVQTLATASITQDLRFPGQWMQGESGLAQNGMRDYDPTLGRYIEADPIGLAGGSNLFAYANSNPLKYTDPTGKCAELVSGLICAAMAGAAIGFVEGIIIDYAIQKYWEGRCQLDYNRMFESGLWGAAGGAVGNVAAPYLLRGARYLPRLWQRAASEAGDVGGAAGGGGAGGSGGGGGGGAGGGGAAGTPETIVIGEDMGGRVIPTAEARGANFYNPPEAPPEQWMQNNKDWINQKMDEGCTILDCGAAPGRPNYPDPSSPYYQMELEQIRLRNYPDYQQIPAIGE